jgi:hypothetical protein
MSPPSSRYVSLTLGSNEPGTRSHSHFSPEGTPDVQSPPVPELTSDVLPEAPTYFPIHPPTSTVERTVIPRYMINTFRTPEIPRTTRLPSSGFIAQSPPTSSPK